MSLILWSTEEIRSVLDSFNYVPNEAWTDTQEELLEMFCDELHRRDKLQQYGEQFSPVECETASPILNKVTSRYLKARETNQSQARETADEFRKYIEDLTHRAQATKYWHNGLCVRDD